MKILHTSDWHLGHTLYNYDRTEEQQERIPIQIQVIQEGNNSSSKVKIIPDVPQYETASV